jgi:hypothetical protein
VAYFLVFAGFIVAAYGFYRWVQQRDNIDEDVTWDEGETEEPPLTRDPTIDV